MQTQSEPDEIFFIETGMFVKLDCDLRIISIAKQFLPSLEYTSFTPFLLFFIFGPSNKIIRIRSLIWLKVYDVFTELS